jgi:uncharacterized protein (TIGR03435 family)
MGNLTAITLFAAVASAALGQTTPEGPSFDVASVKPAAPLPSGVIMMRMGGGIGTVDPGRIDETNITLKSLVASAYGVKEYQVEGPAWLDSERYDVMATIPKGADREQVKRMMQRLLAERFQLAFHRESKPLNVYTLSVAKSGSKLKEVDPATLPPLPERGSAAPPPPPPPGAGGGRVNGDFMKAGPMPAGAMRMMMTPGGRHIMGNVNLEKLCDLLSNFLDRPVIDLTDLKAMYQLDLLWTPTDSEKMGGKVGPKMAPPGAVAGRGDSQPGNDAASEPGPTLAEALLKTYGLKLEAKKDPADILVIDHADKVPTEN